MPLLWMSLMTGLMFFGSFSTSSNAKDAGPAIHVSSQCFKSLGIPRVSFSCPHPRMILILRAFHGIGLSHRSIQPSPAEAPRPAHHQQQGPHHQRCYSGPGFDPVNCTYCPGDCIDDSMNPIYDWSTCLGFGSCVRTVMQSHMPACYGRDKFSDYLQVEYQCVPKTRVVDICSDTQDLIPEAGGFLTSPGYPDVYPPNEDCICRMVADRENARLTLVFYDLLLETKKGRCRADWVMLRQNAERHRHCGAMILGTNNVTSSSNTIDLQFHSDALDNRVQNFNYFTRKLKGFWLHFRADRGASVQISCRKLDRTDPAVQEFEAEDVEYDEVAEGRGIGGGIGGGGGGGGIGGSEDDTKPLNDTSAWTNHTIDDNSGYGTSSAAAAGGGGGGGMNADEGTNGILRHVLSILSSVLSVSCWTSRVLRL